MIAENFVIKGSFFLYKSKDQNIRDLFQKIKEKITIYLSSKGYYNSIPDTIFSSYAEMQFELAIPHKEKPKKFILFPKKAEENPYYKQLERTRNGTPWTIKIYFFPGRLGDQEGLNIDIISEPAIFFKIDQMGYNSPIDQQEYSFIIYPNSQFVIGLAKAMFFTTISEPKPIHHIGNTEISLKLKKNNFVKVADLLEKGRSKIEFGNSEDGLTDLRSSIELFFVDLLNRLGQNPNPQDKVEANINILEKLGYLDGKMKSITIRTLYNSIYRVISDEATHKRESLNLFDARLLFSVTEDFFDYMLEKILRYNIKDLSKTPSEK